MLNMKIGNIKNGLGNILFLRVFYFSFLMPTLFLDITIYFYRSLLDIKISFSSYPLKILIGFLKL